MSNGFTPDPSPNYMSSDWGNSKQTALHIDHLADKAKFAIEMLESALKGFDTIEKEIVDATSDLHRTPKLFDSFLHGG